MTFAYLMLGWMASSIVAGLSWGLYRAFFPRRPLEDCENEMLPRGWEG